MEKLQISKELIAKVIYRDDANESAILKIHQDEFCNIKVDWIGFDSEIYNIYEIEHRCKKWALSKGFQFVYIEQRNYTYIVVTKYGNLDDISYHKFYPHAITTQCTLDYCEWILEQQK